MIDFKPIELLDKEIFDKYYSINKDISSEYNFTTLFAWQEMFGNYYAIVNDCLCIKNADGYCYPIGNAKDTNDAICELVNEHKHNDKFKLISVTKRMLNEFEELHKQCLYKVNERRELFDYMYDRDKLATLVGKKFSKKRNHLNYFKNTYTYDFVDLDESNMQDTIKFIKTTIDERSLDPEKELFATLKVMKYSDKLGLVSKVLIVDNKIIGLIMAQNHNDTVLIQIAKADIEYRGASVALFSFLLQDYFTDLQYANFMEDLGIEGLRKMKLSYNPVFLIEKYSIERIICRNN